MRPAGSSHSSPGSHAAGWGSPLWCRCRPGCRSGGQSAPRWGSGSGAPHSPMLRWTGRPYRWPCAGSGSGSGPHQRPRRRNAGCGCRDRPPRCGGRHTPPGYPCRTCGGSGSRPPWRRWSSRAPGSPIFPGTPAMSGCARCCKASGRFRSGCCRCTPCSHRHRRSAAVPSVIPPRIRSSGHGARPRSPRSPCPSPADPPAPVPPGPLLFPSGRSGSSRSHSPRRSSAYSVH